MTTKATPNEYQFKQVDNNLTLHKFFYTLEGVEDEALIYFNSKGGYGYLPMNSYYSISLITYYTNSPDADHAPSLYVPRANWLQSPIYDIISLDLPISFKSNTIDYFGITLNDAILKSPLHLGKPRLDGATQPYISIFNSYGDAGGEVQCKISTIIIESLKEDYLIKAL